MPNRETRLGESWTHHFLQKNNKKCTKVGLVTFWFGLVNILSYKDLCLSIKLIPTIYSSLINQLIMFQKAIHML